MSKDLEKAAAAWDAAERNGRLNQPAPEPDTRPRNSLTNQPMTFNIKVTIGGKPLFNNHSNPFSR